MLAGHLLQLLFVFPRPCVALRVTRPPTRAHRPVPAPDRLRSGVSFSEAHAPNERPRRRESTPPPTEMCLFTTGGAPSDFELPLLRLNTRDLETDEGAVQAGVFDEGESSVKGLVSEASGS